MSHRHLKLGPDGRPNDDFDASSLKGKESNVGFLGADRIIGPRGVYLIFALVLVGAIVYGFKNGMSFPHG